MGGLFSVLKGLLSVMGGLFSVLKRLLSVMEGLLSVLKRLLSVMERLFSVLRRLLSRRKVSRPHFLRVKRNVGKKRKKGRLSERSEFEPL